MSAGRSQTRRGLQDIRTLSGASGRAGGVKRTYSRLAALAMELQRREHEQKTSEVRATVAMRRARSLERDIGEILDQLRERVDRPAPPREAAPGTLSIRYGARRRTAPLEGRETR